MGTYTTILGDTWDMISFKNYGKEKYARELVEANLEYVETIVFSAGIILNVPEIKTETEYSSLPPWKRGNTNAST